MCGIAGIFNHRTGNSPDATRIAAVLESMKYRGPDHTGVLHDGELCFGNVRLSIIGLGPAANQPVTNEDGSVAVVYNGEIYNYREIRDRLLRRGHRFATESDTEILVHLYEDDGVQLAGELNGMFAFALFDRTKRTLLLGRDRTAQKPLYLAETSDGLVWASEIKALLPLLDKRRLDARAVRQFLSLGYSLEPNSLVEGVRALQPGTVMCVSQSGVSHYQYWRPSDSGVMQIPGADYLARMDEVLRQATSRHLESDVPVTLFLSGGVDSSILGTYLAESGAVREAFTGSFVDGGDHDEYSAASRLGRQLGIVVNRIPLSRADLAASLDDFLSQSSMPQGDYSGLATFCLAREAARSYRVVLGGDGGDELFGGYPTYTLPFLRRNLPFIRPAMLRGAWHIAQRLGDKRRYLSWPFKLQQLAQAWRDGAMLGHFEVKNFLPATIARRLLREPADEFSEQMASLYDHIGSELGTRDTVSRLTWVDFRTFLQSGTIPKVERNTMAHSLEARLPFLDNDVVSLSLSTPTRMKVRATATKVCLRQLLLRRLASRGGGVNARKQGFSPPLVSMLDNELAEWRAHWLNKKTSYLVEAPARVVAEWKRAGWDLHRLEWNLCVLADWSERNGCD